MTISLRVALPAATVTEAMPHPDSHDLRGPQHTFRARDRKTNRCRRWTIPLPDAAGLDSGGNDRGAGNATLAEFLTIPHVPADTLTGGAAADRRSPARHKTSWRPKPECSVDRFESSLTPSLPIFSELLNARSRQ